MLVRGQGHVRFSNGMGKGVGKINMRNMIRSHFDARSVVCVQVPY
jgi:hypothetical protein